MKQKCIISILSMLSLLAVMLLPVIPAAAVDAGDLVAPHYITGTDDSKYILNDANTTNMVLANGKNLMSGRWDTASNAKGTAVLKNVFSYYGWNYDGAGGGWCNVQAQAEVSSADVLSDGRMYNVSFTNSWSNGWLEIGGTNHTANGDTALDTYEMVKVIFDLGESKSLGRILFGDRNDSGNPYLAGRLWKGELYVGDQFGDDLFTDANKKGEWSYIDDSVTSIGSTDTTDKMGVVFEFDKAIAGRYVGIYVPAAGPSVGYQIRLSEVGIYAAEDTVHFLADAGDAAFLQNDGKNLAADILANGQASGNNWVASGLTTMGDTAEAHVRNYATTLSYLTDGKIAGINGEVDEHTTIQVGVNNQSVTRTEGWGYKVGKLTFNLGESKKLGRILLGFPNVGTANYNPFMGTIYVSDSQDTLYSADSVVGYWNYLIGDNNMYGSLPSAITDKGVVLDFADGISGQYVGFAMPANSGIGYGVRVSEVGIYEYVESKVANLGAAVRNADSHQGEEDYALRFGFTLDNTSIGYQSTDPKTENNYKRTDGTIRIGDSTYTVTDMGAILTLEEDYETALANPDALVGNTKAVKAVNLYNVESGTITFTAVVTNVPYSQADTTVYARSYVQYENAAGEEITILGDIIARSVNDVLINAEM